MAKLQSGAGGYDVAVPSDYMVSIMARQGLLADLDRSKIPNVRLLADRLRGLPFDPENRYSIPYLWGTVGIAYDSDVITSPPDSWEILWDPRYKRKISMLNDQREVFGVALRALGYSLNETTPAVIEQAKIKLMAQKPLVKTYTSENYDNLLISGDVVLAHGWGGAVARAMEERPSLRYVVPKEGGHHLGGLLRRPPILPQQRSRHALHQLPAEPRRGGPNHQPSSLRVFDRTGQGPGPPACP